MPAYLSRIRGPQFRESSALIEWRILLFSIAGPRLSKSHGDSRIVASTKMGRRVPGTLRVGLGDGNDCINYDDDEQVSW
jgi:hypothetical protein